MNLLFKKINLAAAENGEGAVVRSVDRELMAYERGDYRLFIEVYFPKGQIVAYEPEIPLPLPAGLTEEEVRREIHAGVEVTAEGKVEWRAG